MIIFRYLSKDILISTFAVSLILLLIFLTGRFVNLLADAAAGKYAVDVIFLMIGCRLPWLLQIIIPLAFFIAILLAYGRLYMESEMVVLHACGMSQGQLLSMTIIPAIGVALLVGFFSFWLSPMGAERYAQIEDEQRNRSEFDSLSPGRFQTLGQSQITTYVDGISQDRKQLENVFIARDGSEKSGAVIAVSESAEQIKHTEYGQRYLVLHNGVRYEGKPGTADFRVTTFSTFGQLMPQIKLSGDYTQATDAKSSLSLLQSESRVLRAELQWRLSFPLLVFIATLLAVPLSKTKPRQGRFLKMLPALLLYIFYFTFLMSARTAVSNGKLPIYPGLWVVHIPFLMLALVLFHWENIKWWNSRRIARKYTHA